MVKKVYNYFWNKLLRVLPLKKLPGTAYSRYSMPLDYMPSRDYTPRYGYSRKVIQEIDEWFSQHADDYAVFIQYMRSVDTAKIPLQLSMIKKNDLQLAWMGGPISPFDSLALYSMIQFYKPSTYLEIGSGITTLFVHKAKEVNKLNTKIISIDPSPRRQVDDICAKVIRESLESTDLSIFETLNAGDILFLDGSHRCFMNSDVTVFFIDILPKIKPGVIIHIHDILLPYDYPPSFKNWYWNEQYLLAVYFMASMDKIKPLLPTTWINRSEKLAPLQEIPFIDFGSPELNAEWKGGGSMWFTKI